MKKADMIKKVAETAGCTQKAVGEVLGAYVDVIATTLKADKDESIPFPGVGTFKIKEVPAREGTIYVGDKQGQKWSTPAHNEIAFALSKKFKKFEE